MEFVVVSYFRSRNVYLDGKLIGKTNQTLRVEEGTHLVDLGEPKNYAPPSQKIRMTATTQILPLEIEFQYKEALS
jgi:polygalacturonase